MRYQIPFLYMYLLITLFNSFKCNSPIFSDIMAATKLNLIVAVCETNGIGIEGRLPWRLKQDMAFFKKITMQTKDEHKSNMLIMGKNTWNSIPAKFRPLPGRENVVLSNTLTEAPPGARLASSLREAVRLAESNTNIENVFIIGGASVYRAAVESEWPCRLYVTRIHKQFECDTFFDIEFDDSSVFTKINVEDIPEHEHIEGEVAFTFEVYEKK